MTKHTPGPWVAIRARDWLDNPYRVSEKQRDEFWLVRRADDRGGVVRIDRRRDGDAEFRFSTEADASKVASAPDLLAACKAMLAADGKNGYSAAGVYEARKMMAEAIAKAEGR